MLRRGLERKDVEVQLIPQAKRGQVREGHETEWPDNGQASAQNMVQTTGQTDKCEDNLEEGVDGSNREQQQHRSNDRSKARTVHKFKKVFTKWNPYEQQEGVTAEGHTDKMGENHV